MSDWYAVMTTSRKEADAERHLRLRGINTFFPHTCEWIGLKAHRARLIKRPLFAGYLFVESEKGGLFTVASSPFVATIVRGARDQPYPVPTKFIEHLMEKADPLGQLHRQEANAKPSKFAGKPGDMIRMKEGHSLWGFIAEVKRVSGEEIFVELKRAILGTKYAHVPIEFAELLSA